MAYVNWVGGVSCILASVIRLNWVGAAELGAFLTHLAVLGKRVVSTKNQLKGQRYFHFLLNCFLHSRGPQSLKLCCPDDLIKCAFVEKGKRSVWLPDIPAASLDDAPTAHRGHCRAQRDNDQPAAPRLNIVEARAGQHFAFPAQINDPAE